MWYTNKWHSHSKYIFINQESAILCILVKVIFLHSSIWCIMVTQNFSSSMNGRDEMCLWTRQCLIYFIAEINVVLENENTWFETKHIQAWEGTAQYLVWLFVTNYCSFYILFLKGTYLEILNYHFKIIITIIIIDYDKTQVFFLVLLIVMVILCLFLHSHKTLTC